MPHHYHESFWAALAGVAAALIITQVIAEVAHERLRIQRWKTYRERPEQRKRRRALAIWGYGGYIMQAAVLATSLLSLAHESDWARPTVMVCLETLLVASVPLAFRLAEDATHEPKSVGDQNPTVAESG